MRGKPGKYNDVASIEYHLMAEDDPVWIEAQQRATQKILAWGQNGKDSALFLEALGL